MRRPGSRHPFPTLCAAVAGALIALAAQAQAPKDELADLRSRLEALQKELEQTEETRSEAADALRTSERAISTARRRLRELETERRAIERSLSGLSGEARGIEQRIAAEQDAMGRLLAQQYMGGEREPLRLLLNRENPNEAARELHYYTYLARARALVLERLRADLVLLERTAESSRQKKGELEAVLKEHASEVENLKKEKAARASALRKISAQVKTQRKEIDRLKRDEARLAKLVEELARALAARRKPAPARPAPPGPGLEGRPFAELKGQLGFPVKGELAARYGSPREGGLTWKGVVIRADGGQDVAAVAEGRVVYADWLRGFGNLLILDHGEGYMSLYGYNESLLKRVGERVRGGDAVAVVGNTGGGAQSALYFEIRHEGKPLDPMSWLKRR